jgi:hypothetical protein
MTFAVPMPFINHRGKPCIELDDKILFGRLIDSISQQWPEHDVIGATYAISAQQWNAASVTEVRMGMLVRLRESLFHSAADEDKSVVCFSPVVLLDTDNRPPSSTGGLARLRTITAKDNLPVLAPPEHNIRVLFQQAHIISPMTVPGTRRAGLTSRGNVG